MRILLVEDDPILTAGIREALERERWLVDHVGAAEPAASAVALTAYDLAIVDIGLPGMDGLSLVRRLRREGRKLPILILTARDGLEDRVDGLDSGGDDYLTKPFLLPELMARLRALIRRSRASASPLLQVGPLALDQLGHTASLADSPLDLTGREWSVLEQLMLAAPRVANKSRLAESLSQWDREITANAVEIYISRLRGKLGSSMTIRTVRGIGYRLEEGGQ